MKIYNPDSIKELRNKLKMTQMEFAAAIDVPQMTVYRWENDKSVPKANHLERILNLADSRGLKANLFISIRDDKSIAKMIETAECSKKDSEDNMGLTIIPVRLNKRRDGQYGGKRKIQLISDNYDSEALKKGNGENSNPELIQYHSMHGRWFLTPFEAKPMKLKKEGDEAILFYGSDRESRNHEGEAVFSRTKSPRKEENFSRRISPRDRIMGEIHESKFREYLENSTMDVFEDVLVDIYFDLITRTFPEFDDKTGENRLLSFKNNENFPNGNKAMLRTIDFLKEEIDKLTVPEKHILELYYVGKNNIQSIVEKIGGTMTVERANQILFSAFKKLRDKILSSGSYGNAVVTNNNHNITFH